MEVIDFNSIKIQSIKFIEKVKKLSVSKGKYNIYAITFTPKKDGYCITYGYVSSPTDTIYIKNYKYVFFIEKEMILLNFPKTMLSKYKLINNSSTLISNRKIIAEKIAPEPLLGISCGYVFCKKGKEITETFYDNDETIPNDLAIKKYKKNKGKLIQIDSTTFKEIINSPQ